MRFQRQMDRRNQIHPNNSIIYNAPFSCQLIFFFCMFVCVLSISSVVKLLHQQARCIGFVYMYMYNNNICVWCCSSVDFGAGWLWFIRSPLKNRCGKGNEMHKKRICMCVPSVSDHGFFFFFTIHYPRLYVRMYIYIYDVCVGEKKMRLRTGCVIMIIIIILLLLLLMCTRVASWFIVSCRGFTPIPPPVVAAPRLFFTAMQTF